MKSKKVCIRSGDAGRPGHPGRSGQASAGWAASGRATAGDAVHNAGAAARAGLHAPTFILCLFESFLCHTLPTGVANFARKGVRCVIAHWHQIQTATDCVRLVAAVDILRGSAYCYTSASCYHLSNNKACILAGQGLE